MSYSAVSILVMGEPELAGCNEFCVFFWRRVGLALLRMSEEALLPLPFERLLTALNSKQYAAFARPPGQLLRQALSFRVSRRLAASQARSAHVWRLCACAAWVIAHFGPEGKLGMQ